MKKENRLKTRTKWSRPMLRHFYSKDMKGDMTTQQHLEHSIKTEDDESI